MQQSYYMFMLPAPNTQPMIQQRLMDSALLSG